MRSFAPIFALAGAAAAAVGNYTVDAATIDTAEKADWCLAQINTCRTLCQVNDGGRPTEDSCTPSTLEYGCTCRNGSAPGLDYYRDTMPFNLCQKSFQLCIEDNVGDAKAQDACKTEIQDTCGSLDPADAQELSAAAATTSAEEEAPEPTEAAEEEDPESAAALNSLPRYGSAAGAVAVGLFAYLL